jgi:hypothetical protein
MKLTFELNIIGDDASRNNNVVEFFDSHIINDSLIWGTIEKFIKKNKKIPKVDMSYNINFR